jgi:hypothetical protein
MLVSALTRIVVCAVLVCGGVASVESAAAEGGSDGSASASTDSDTVHWTYQGRTYKMSRSGQPSASTSTNSAAPVTREVKRLPAAPAAPATEDAGHGWRSLLITGSIIIALVLLAVVAGGGARRKVTSPSEPEPAMNDKGLVVDLDHNHAGTGVITITRRHRKSTEAIVEEKVRERQAALATVTATPAAMDVTDDNDDNPFEEAPKSITERIVAKHTHVVTRRRSASDA